MLGPAFVELPGVKVVALLGRDPKRSAEVAARLDQPVVVSSLAELLDCGLDAVALALPPDVNEEVVSAALDRRLAVFSEKPLARSGNVATSLLAKSQGLVTALDFEFAELATFRSLSDALADGLVGQIRHVEVTWLTQSRAIEQRSWSWKTDAARGGGVLPLLGSHVVHLLEQVFGPVARVLAAGGNATTAEFAPPGATAALDTVSALLRLTSGVTVNLILGNAERGVQLHEWRISGESGALVARNSTLDPVHGFNLRLLRDRTEAVLAAERSPVVGVDGRTDAVRTVARRFVEAIQHGADISPTFREGARAAVVLDALQRSALENRLIDVEQAHGH